jgi:gliding motility-associated-like protein
MTYLWKFSDNTTQTITDAIKTFTSPGTYTAHLTATTSFGCVDESSDSTMYVMPNVNAAFTWDSICINRPVQFYNQSRENGSTLVNYSWNFDNGGPAFLIKNPPLVTYITPGKVDVVLKIIAFGCESYPDSVIKKIQVNKPKDGYRYKDITVPQGSSQFIHVRSGIGNTYLWKPRLQLSGYNAQYTEFFATADDVKYLIDITDQHTCITTDTLLMQVLKKPGFYLPTAFTPNGDGLNDFARPYLVGMKTLKNFSVFNRWGNLIFYSSKYGEGWDGKSKGADQNAGVYVWILEFINDDGKKVTEKGTITIIR